MRASYRLSPVTRWVERCLQCTVVIFSLVSPDNMAKHFESSLLDECCNRRLPSSRAHFRITVNMGCIYRMWRMLCRRYWSNASKHLCDATVRLQMSVAEVYTIPDSTVQGFMQVHASSIFVWTSWSFPPLQCIQDPTYTKEFMA